MTDDTREFRFLGERQTRHCPSALTRSVLEKIP
jgi:hypothetical protein